MYIQIRNKSDSGALVCPDVEIPDEASASSAQLAAALYKEYKKGDMPLIAQDSNPDLA